MIVYFISKKNSKTKTIFTIIMFAIFICCQITFAKSVSYTFEEIVLKSDIIIQGLVLNIDKNIFKKNTSQILINQIIAGEIGDKRLIVEFGRKNIFYAKEDLTELHVNQEYVLFLKKENEKYRIVGLNTGCYSIHDGKITLDESNLQLKDFIQKIKFIKSRTNSEAPDK